jgi:dihydrofolate reductase
MRKITAGLHISMDGVVESPEQWVFPNGYSNDEMQQAIGAGMAEADTMLLGRRTYQEFAAHWPRQEGEVANYMNSTAKLVVSTTLDKAEWQNSTLVRDDVVAELNRRKQQPGRNLNVVGSITLVRSLLREGLLDELSLFLCPIVVGDGKRLFDGVNGPRPMRLADARTFTTGVQWLTYRPKDS